MLTTTLAVFAILGMLLGLLGATIGVLAFRRSQAMTDDFLSSMRHVLPTSEGVDTRAIRDVALIRYDALEEMSGAHSFSLALLNTTGDGVVLTSINSRSETRTYAKIVTGGSPADTLSPEEYRAVRAARLGCGVGNSAPERKRTREEPKQPEKPGWEESGWEESTWKHPWQRPETERPEDPARGEEAERPGPPEEAARPEEAAQEEGARRRKEGDGAVPEGDAEGVAGFTGNT